MDGQAAGLRGQPRLRGRKVDGQGKLRSLAKGRSLLMSSGSAGRGALWGVGSCASSLSSDSSIGLLTVSCSSGQSSGRRLPYSLRNKQTTSPRTVEPGGGTAQGGAGRARASGRDPLPRGSSAPSWAFRLLQRQLPFQPRRQPRDTGGSLLSRCWSVWLVDTAPAWGWARRPCTATSAYRERHLAGGLWGPAVIEVGLTGRRLVHRLRGGGRHAGGRRGHVPDCS